LADGCLSSASGKGIFAMSFEIERKFLVVNDSWRAAVIDSDLIRDGLISESDSAKVRVRLGRKGAWLTVKSSRSGPSRLEFEYEIPRFDAEVMLQRLCDQAIFAKTRHKVEHAGNIWLVDVYSGQLSGIVLAEIELQSEDEFFELPDWIGQEVTCNPRFHKRIIGRLCREAGRPLSIADLLNDRSDVFDLGGAVSLAS
jgi:CYTH domain-containing protein